MYKYLILIDFCMLFQVACVKGGLPAVIHKMWPSCTVNRLILVSVLKMLCALTAQHPIGIMQVLP